MVSRGSRELLCSVYGIHRSIKDEYFYDLVTGLFTMLVQKANLLSVYDPSHLVESHVEVEDLLDLIHGHASFVKPLILGVHILAAKESPRRIIGRLRYLYALEPEKFQYTMSWVPADFWCSNSVDDVVDLVSRAGKDVGEEESWKIVVRMTESEVKGVDNLVDTLSRCIVSPRVNLANPEKIVYVHFIGGEASVSLLGPDDILEIAPDMPMPPVRSTGAVRSLP